MGIFLNILILLGGLIAGTLLIKYSYQLTQIFGHNDYAERYLGDGGTYSMWKLLGLVVIVVAVWYVF